MTATAKLPDGTAVVANGRGEPKLFLSSIEAQRIARSIPGAAVLDVERVPGGPGPSCYVKMPNKP
jgi:hypothetical protein